MNFQLSEFIPLIISTATTLLVGIIIIILIRILAQRVLEKRNLDPSVQIFILNITKWVLRTLLFVTIISKLGVQTSGIVAIIGAAGLAIGLALQGSLANFAGSVLILLFKPFKTGDYIAAASGVEGTVKVIDLFHTRLITPQNQLIVVPNGELSNGNIINYSAFDTRRTWFNIRIPYDANLQEVKNTLLKVAEAHPLALKDPAPQIFVSSLDKDAVIVSVRVWAKSSDYWTMIEELMMECKQTLFKAGINIPYPQVRILQEENEDKEEL